MQTNFKLNVWRKPKGQAKMHNSPTLYTRHGTKTAKAKKDEQRWSHKGKLKKEKDVEPWCFQMLHVSSDCF